MAERLLNNLIAAVTNLRDNPEGNNNTVQNGSARSPAATTSETTEGALRRLYPSIDQPPVVRNNIPEDRSTVNNLTRFNPSIDYRPRKGKKNPVRPSKRKHSGSSRQSKATFKDVILLPSPTINVVPRGKNREELFAKCFAESALEISDEMSEQTINELFNRIFQRKLNSLPDPKFSFVRAIGNKIIPVSTGPFTGKLLKYLAKQGAIYIRANTDVDKNWRSWFKEVVENAQIKLSSDDSENDDELPCCPFDIASHGSTAKSCTTRNIVESSSTDSHGNTANSFTTRVIESFSPTPGISCPTCCNFFSPDTIEEHADLCAEEAGVIPATRRRYVDLLGEDEQLGGLITESISDIDQAAEDDEDPSKCDVANDTSNTKERLSAVITALRVNMSIRENRVHVRRKKLWVDFLQYRKSSKWFIPDGGLRIVFIGEPAVDGGGPRREFFTGMFIGSCNRPVS